MTLVLIGIILALVAGIFVNALPSASLDAAARDISTTLRQARALAQMKGIDQTVTFDLDSKQYGIEGSAPRIIPPEVFIRIDDPASGEIQKGSYTMVFRVAGGIEGGIIVVWRNQKTMYIEADPVVGSTMVKK